LPSTTKAKSYEPSSARSLASISRESSHLICRRSKATPSVSRKGKFMALRPHSSQAARQGSCSSSTCGRAIRDAGGFPLGEGFLTPETIAEVATELVAMSEALEELETEEAGAGA
jgi:hypothetical protein